MVVAFILNWPLPVRFNGIKLSTVSHVGLLLTAFHVLLDATLITALPAADVGLHEVVGTLRVGAPSCVTVIVSGFIPGTDTVTDPVLATVLVLVVAFNLNEPLPVRFGGLILLTVSHVGLLLTTFQVLLDVTLIIALPVAFVCKSHLFDDIVSDGAGSCVTVIVRVTKPGTATDTTPVLGAVPVLAVTFILKEPLPVWLNGLMLLIVIYVTLRFTVQVLLDVTVTAVKFAADDGFHTFPDNVRVATLNASK